MYQPAHLEMFLCTITYGWLYLAMNATLKIRHGYLFLGANGQNSTLQHLLLSLLNLLDLFRRLFFRECVTIDRYLGHICRFVWIERWNSKIKRIWVSNRFLRETGLRWRWSNEVIFILRTNNADFMKTPNCIWILDGMFRFQCWQRIVLTGTFLVLEKFKT